MATKIDWLSFSLPVRLSAPTEGAYALAIETALVEGTSNWIADNLFAGNWKHVARGRQPYKDTWTQDAKHMSLYTHPDLNHLTVEFGGQGCDYLREEGYFEPLMGYVAHRVTRLDVATDIETDTSPQHFVEAGVSARFSGRGVFDSATGQTVYIGSQKSDKFARVYRYANPHPRSHLLRVEHVLRRTAAKEAARLLCDSDVETLAASVGKSFGWEHPDWALRESTVAPLRVVYGSRQASGTMRWLLTSVAPAFKRMVQTGEIADPEAFIRTYFLDNLGIGD